MALVIKKITEAIRGAAIYNPDIQVAPACILWPDRDRQFEAVMPRLQVDLPELLILGDYAPEKRTGPAIWLRCIIAGKIEEVSLPADCTPIFYLPGVGRQDLRAVEDCPDPLKPLAELQFRGVIWSQLNSKDWTILAFLKSNQGGLGLDVAQDNKTKNAMQLALYRLLDEEVDLLKGKHLDKDYFNTLLTGGDPVRDLLQWLDQGDAFRDSRDENEWLAFVEVCQSQLGFHPRNEGVLAGTAKLVTREGPWKAVWERFTEAPKRYPNIPAQIRKCRPPSDTLLWHMDDGSCDGWPQWNEDREKTLKRDLQALGSVPAHDARKKLLEMERQHGRRRQLVWAELGEAPLAMALEHLSLLADVTRKSLTVGTIEEMAAEYRTTGWKADDAVIRALACIDKPEDLEAVTSAVRAVYLPWAEESARHLQKTTEGAAYPGGTCHSAKPVLCTEGECILFIDGLRLDAGKRLAELLENAGCAVTEEPFWAPLPSVTATGKPAVAPLHGADKISEGSAGYNFEPITDYLFRKTILEKGWKILKLMENADGQGNAWCEFGNIDHEGHDRGWKLSRHIGSLLAEIRDRITSLLAAGWKKVHVVTDHGWLLLPGGLPKSELPSVLADTKWGRCASLKPGASTKERLYPWYWNPNQFFALADGISCYKKGEEYAHGGLSLQECLTLRLTVSPNGSTAPPASVEITAAVWKGLRCTVIADGDVAGLSLDIRLFPGDPSSSVVGAVKPLKDNGTASVLVENEDLEGRDATAVLLDADGAMVAQIPTVIGGGKE